MAAQKEEDGVECVAANLADLLLCDFSKGECCAPLQIYVVGKRECCQRGKWVSLEEVGLRAVW